MAVSELNAKLKAVERMVSLFKMERMTYLGVTLISLIMLLGAGIYMFIDGKVNQMAVLSLMFGSSGLITYSAGRLLKMWDQAIKMLSSNDNESGD